jgi:hypothetical protein
VVIAKRRSNRFMEEILAPRDLYAAAPRRAGFEIGR